MISDHRFIIQMKLLIHLLIQLLDHGPKIYDASTNMSAHDPTSTNLPAHSPTLRTSPPIVQHT